jgi:DNA-binding PadR family transcriptional regulator
MSEPRLREFEELVLLSVRMTGEDASGVTIQQALDTEAGRAVSLGAIYTALDRLARKGLVESWLGEPTPVRGGRRKRHYRLTPSGLKHLTEIHRIRNSMWAKVEHDAVKKGAAS